MSVLSLKNVVKRYHNHIAVNDVSFDVHENRIFGLLGPNGAGKTSLIRMITTITQIDDGEIYIAGEKLNPSHTAWIGYMPEERGLYKKMKVGEQLLFLAQIKGLTKEEAYRRIKVWFEKFEITSWWGKRVEELSKGMQQKIQFISTVVHQPKILILDEPFSGLDPINANLIKDEIYRLSQEGTSIIFSTHRMEQVEEVCQDIVLMNGGKIILNGEVNAIKESYKNHEYHVTYRGDLPALNNTGLNLGVHRPGEIHIKSDADTPANQILQTLINQGVAITGFSEIRPSLNEIFISKVEEQTHA